MIFAAALVTAVLASAPPRAAAPQADAACLHFGKEAPEQRDRSVAALGATRAINTAQANYSAKNKSYAAREALAGYLDGARYNLLPDAEIVPGFKLTLDTTQKGYWFAITDVTDPCKFSYISNQNGLIFAAQPIR
jgi:hypothetical protein